MNLIAAVKKRKKDNSPHNDSVYLALKEGKEIKEKFKEYIILLRIQLESTMKGITWHSKELRLRRILRQLHANLFKGPIRFIAKNTLMSIVAQNFPSDNITVKKLIQLEAKFHEKR